MNIHVDWCDTRQQQHININVAGKEILRIFKICVMSKTV